MGNIRKNYSSTFKAEVVLELLRETKSIAEISTEYKVHPTQLKRWRKEALANLPQLFSKQEDWGKEKAEYEEKIGELYKYPSNRPHIESIDAS
jgi:transposase-like protein